MIRALLVVLVALALLLGYALWGKSRADNRAERAQEAAERTAQELADTRAALASERKRTAAMADIGSTHEEDRRDAEGVPAAVVAAVQSGDLRLRNDLARCHTDRLSAAATGAGERHATAELRAEVAGDLVRVGRDADDQLRACQAVVMADREHQ